MRSVKKNKLSSIVFFLCISFVVSVLVAGCSGDGDSAAQPRAATNPVPVPFTNTSSSHLTATALTGEGHGLFSWLLDTVMEGLQEGITVWIGDKTTGRLLDIITHHSDEGSAELAAMNSKMEAISQQLDFIQSQLASLSDELKIKTIDVKNYITSTSLQSHISNIKTVYEGANENGLLGISGLATDPAHQPPNTTLLKQYTETFVSTNSGAMDKEIVSIHDLICPDVASLNGVLKDYADKIVNAVPSNNGLSDADNAYATYQLLETFFAQILTYQTEANIIVTEISNYKDPSGAAANAWLNGNSSKTGIYYKKMLEEEVARFLQTVNYLMVNTIDYRTSAKFNKDAKYMLAQGLAPDETYKMVYARSRYFSAQILKSFENNFGLVGSIVTPHDYSPGTQKPVTKVKLQFTGPATFSKTVDATTILSQFPYTKWDHATAKSHPDNTWSFYDFNGFGDIPAGTYKVTLVDDGNANTPWYHTSTDFGTVSVMYYNPTTFDPTHASTTPTATNTLKFGYFSGRWDWGYSRLSSSPMGLWVVPSKTAYVMNINANGGSVSGSTDNPALWGKNNTYYPKKGASVAAVNTFGVSLPMITVYKGMEPVMAYTVNLPVIVTPAPGDGAAKASAEIFYNTGGNISFNLYGGPAYSHAYFDYLLIDSAKNGSKHSITNFSSPSTNYSVNQSAASQGIMSSTIIPNHTYNFSVDGGFNASVMNIPYGPLCTTNLTGTMDLSWNMQVVYTNKYDIF